MHIKLPFIGLVFKINALRIGPARKQWVEIWWRSGSWRRPSEWVWGTDRSCLTGCVIVDCGWWGFTILRGDCQTFDL